MCHCCLQGKSVTCPICQNSYPEHRLKYHIKTSHPGKAQSTPSNTLLLFILHTLTYSFHCCRIIVHYFSFMCLCLCVFLDRCTPSAGKECNGEACRKVSVLWLLLPEEQQWLSAPHLGPSGCDMPLHLSQTDTLQTRCSVFLVLRHLSSEPPTVSSPGCLPAGRTRL